MNNLNNTQLSVLALVLGLSASTGAVAQSFTNELGYFGNNTVLEVEDITFTTNASVLALTHYFNPVESVDGPYAEQALLNPQSSMGLALANSTFELEADDWDYSLPDADATGLSVELIDPETGAFVGLTYVGTKMDSLDTDTNILELGVYNEGARYGLTYQIESYNHGYSSNRILGFSYEDIHVDSGEVSYGLIGGIDFLSGDTETTVLTYGGKVYLSNYWGLSLVVSDPDETSETTTMGISLFPGNSMGFDAQLYFGEVAGASLGLNARF